MATILILSGMDLWTMKLDIYVPSRGWFMSQSYSLRLLRRNKAAARRSSGVVGSTGRNAPKIPSPNDISPSMLRIIFAIVQRYYLMIIVTKLSAGSVTSRVPADGASMVASELSCAFVTMSRYSERIFRSHCELFQVPEPLGR